MTLGAYYRLVDCILLHNAYLVGVLMKDSSIANISLLSMAVCAVLLTAMAYRRTVAPATSPTQAAITSDKSWRAIATGGHRIGSAHPQVTVIEFADFQCPYCRAAAHDIDELMIAHSGMIALEFRHYPLDRIHPSAMAAALASECAADQGRFADFYHTVFQEQLVNQWLNVGRYGAAVGRGVAQRWLRLSRTVQDRVQNLVAECGVWVTGHACNNPVAAGPVTDGGNTRCTGAMFSTPTARDFRVEDSPFVANSARSCLIGTMVASEGPEFPTIGLALRLRWREALPDRGTGRAQRCEALP